MTTLPKTIMACALTTAFFASANNNSEHDLPFFEGKREGVQEELIVINRSGSSLTDLGLELATLSALHITENGYSDEVYQKADIAIANAKRLIPEYLKMLTEQANARDVSVRDIVANSIHFDLDLDTAIIGSLNEKLSKGCTTMAFNNGLVGQTIDLPLALLTPETTWIKTDNFIGLLEDGLVYQGMGKHVGVVVNHLGAVSHANPEGNDVVSADMFFYAASQKNSVEEVIELAKQVKTPIAYNFTVADDKGGYAAINLLADGIKVKRGNHRGVAHTNHTDGVAEKFIQSERDYEKMNQMLGWTFARQEAADLFIKYSPELTIEAMQYAFKQRPINLTAYQGDTFATITALVFDMNNGCAYVSPENPRFSQYSQVCFDK